ncbi:MAG: hypothetical protein NTY35_11635 [Planctomycetota bacterium]|nr:hypothetical protein [Planctomycetota bacterium]
MFARSVFSLLALALCASAATAQSSGSAFILNRFGQHVPGNSFPRKDGAFLSGGPGPNCLAPGLADGDYCFQITDPAGTVLLTPDPIQERSVRVVGGRLAQYLGTTRASSQVGPCGALNLRLSPFLLTPYPNREYKLWLTRIADYDPQGTGLFGFDPARSKSDSFRVGAAGPQSILRGQKFFDEDKNAVWNPGTNSLEVPIGGWRVEILRDGVLDGVTYTDQDGWYQFIRNRDGSRWDFRELSPNGFVNDATPGATWLATTPRAGSAFAAMEYVNAPNFGNVSYELVPGAGLSLGFWTDGLADNVPNYPGGEGQSGVAGPGGGGETDTGEDLVGSEILEARDPSWRQSLTIRNGLPVNLRRPISSDAPEESIYRPLPPSEDFYAAFEDWAEYLDSNPRDHAGFLLSRQVAGTILNNTAGLMQGDILIDRFQDGVLVPFETMLAGAIGLLSEVGAGLTGPTGPFFDLRARMIACTNEFGTINNTGDPSSPQVVYRRTSEPSLFASPY